MMETLDLIIIIIIFFFSLIDFGACDTFLGFIDK